MVIKTTSFLSHYTKQHLLHISVDVYIVLFIVVFQLFQSMCYGHVRTPPSFFNIDNIWTTITYQLPNSHLIFSLIFINLVLPFYTHFHSFSLFSLILYSSSSIIISMNTKLVYWESTYLREKNDLRYLFPQFTLLYFVLQIPTLLPLDSNSARANTNKIKCQPSPAIDLTD